MIRIRIHAFTFESNAAQPKKSYSIASDSADKNPKRVAFLSNEIKVGAETQVISQKDALNSILPSPTEVKNTSLDVADFLSYLQQWQSKEYCIVFPFIVDKSRWLEAQEQLKSNTSAMWYSTDAFPKRMDLVERLYENVQIKKVCATVSQIAQFKVGSISQYFRGTGHFDIRQERENKNSLFLFYELSLNA